MSLSMSTFTKSGLDGISADGPSADVVSERRPGDLSRPVTARNDRTGARSIERAAGKDFERSVYVEKPQARPPTVTKGVPLK